jgi:OPC-8:0 CoA ligase-1
MTLEAILRNHPCVKDAAVIAIPDARAGELPKAYVVPAQEVPARELIEYVATRVAPYEQIHDLTFVDAIPTSPSGKTLRRLLVAADREQT